jgi:hypothetical protein
LIRDNNLVGVPPISIDTSNLDKSECIKLITAALLLNNIALIPYDEQSLKVVTIGMNKNPRSEGIRLYTNAADLPTDDQIVNYYMSLDHISGAEAAGIFTQVSPVHVYGGYVPAPSANGVVLTENVRVIRGLIELKKQIDVSRDVLPRQNSYASDPGHPPPHGHHPFLFLVFLVTVFLVGYFVARFRYRNKTV